MLAGTLLQLMTPPLRVSNQPYKSANAAKDLGLRSRTSLGDACSAGLELWTARPRNGWHGSALRYVPGD